MQKSNSWEPVGKDQERKATIAECIKQTRFMHGVIENICNTPILIKKDRGAKRQFFN